MRQPIVKQLDDDLPPSDSTGLGEAGAARRPDFVIIAFIYFCPQGRGNSMSIAKWCVLVACVLPIATVGLAKISSARLSRNSGGYDNNSPREWAGKLTGWQQRACAAQVNGFEALPLFIAGVLFAQMAQADQARIDVLALSFVGIRIAYVAAYLANQGSLRTLIWMVGLGLCVALLAMGA